MDLDRSGRVARSVTAMLRYQSAHGSFVASPDFGQYQFCWLRDASFVGYALDQAGEREAVARYHRWVARALAPLGPAMADAGRADRFGGIREAKTGRSEERRVG